MQDYAKIFCEVLARAVSFKTRTFFLKFHQICKFSELLKYFPIQPKFFLWGEGVKALADDSVNCASTFFAYSIIFYTRAMIDLPGL